MKISKNQLVEFLKNQSKDKDEVLYELLKDEEPTQGIKQEVEEQKTTYICCSSCRYDGGGKCKSNRFKENWRDAVNECIMKDHKYWVEK